MCCSWNSRVPHSPGAVNDEALDDGALPSSLRDVVDVGKRDAAVGHVLGLLDDRDSALTHVEAARGAGANAIGEPLLLERILELLHHLFGALLRARSLWVVGVAAVCANEEIAFAVRHAALL